MEKYDFKKALKNYFTADTETVTQVFPPSMQFLMIDGQGNPANQPFQDAVAALYGIAYGIKMNRKKAGIGPEFSVQNLEGLWWHEKNEPYTGILDERWHWTLMIGQPDFVAQADFEQAKADYVAKKKVPFGIPMRLERFAEGPAIQLLHIGPYTTETRTVHKLERWMRDNKYGYAGKQHEIYLSDPRKTPPEELRTILRQPVVQRGLRMY